MPITIPLTISHINWVDYLRHNRMRGVDTCPVRLEEHGKFLAALGEFQAGEEVNALVFLRKPGDLTKHLHYTFLILASKKFFFKLMELTDLAITYAKDKAVVSGTLSQWRDGTINCLNSYNKPTKEMREVFDVCFGFFGICGVQSIFNDYRKTGLHDETFLLEHK